MCNETGAYFCHVRGLSATRPLATSGAAHAAACRRHMNVSKPREPTNTEALWPTKVHSQFDFEQRLLRDEG
jgi:hypothetical protein